MKFIKPMSRHRRRSRSGYLYVAVLFTALLLSVAVAMSMVRSTAVMHATSAKIDHRRASQLALSELNRLADWMQTDTSWRSQSHNQFSAWRSIIGGEVRHRYSDEDAQLDDDDFDRVTITVHARAGLASLAISADLEMVPTAAPMLNYRVSATDDLEIDRDQSLVCDGPIQAFDEIKGDKDGYITAERTQYGSLVSGDLDIRGDILESAAELITTDPIQLYVDAGTEIPASAIPSQGKDLFIENVLLSATSNPYGPVDPNGIYWIDDKKGKLILKNCRLECTLALKDINEVKIQESVVWTHPPGHPVILLSPKRVKFEDLEAELSEADSATNFNPANTPYHDSYSNTNTTDVFPTEFRGIVFCEKEVEIKESTEIDRVRISGSVIGSKVRIKGYAGVSELRTVFTSPPLGMRSLSSVAFVPGSFRQVETPQ